MRRYSRKVLEGIKDCFCESREKEEYSYIFKTLESFAQKHKCRDNYKSLLENLRQTNIEFYNVWGFIIDNNYGKYSNAVGLYLLSELEKCTPNKNGISGMDDFFSKLNVQDLFKLKEIASLLISTFLYDNQFRFLKFFFDASVVECIGEKDKYWVYYERGKGNFVKDVIQHVGHDASKKHMPYKKYGC